MAQYLRTTSTLHRRLAHAAAGISSPPCRSATTVSVVVGGGGRHSIKPSLGVSALIFARLGDSSDAAPSSLFPVSAPLRRRHFSSTASSSSSSSSPPPITRRPGGGVFDKIAFIGAGKMAQSMVTPLVTSNIQPAANLSIFDVSTTTMDRVASANPGIVTANSIPDCIDGADLVVMAIKPQNLEKVFNEIKKARSSSKLRDDAILLSIIAGAPIASLTDGTGIDRIARSMPNTPAQIGKGVTVWSCTDGISSDERKRIKEVLCSFGKAIFVDDESFIDMSTSISGSGPAYIFLLMEAMIDAGVHMGFSRETATTLVHHTLLGSTLYAMETGEHPAILRNSVTSPAGTTASAIYELENGKFRVVIKDAIWACYRRSLEMGGHASNVGPGRAQHVPEFILDLPKERIVIKPPSGEVTDNGKDH